LAAADALAIDKNAVKAQGAEVEQSEVEGNAFNLSQLI